MSVLYTKSKLRNTVLQPPTREVQYIQATFIILSYTKNVHLLLCHGHIYICFTPSFTYAFLNHKYRLKPSTPVLNSLMNVPSQSVFEKNRWSEYFFAHTTSHHADIHFDSKDCFTNSALVLAHRPSMCRLRPSNSFNTEENQTVIKCSLTFGSYSLCHYSGIILYLSHLCHFL